MVEVWRPGGRSEERRPPRHDRNRHQRNANPSNAAQPAEGEAPADGAKRERTGDRPNQGRRDRSEFRRPRSDAPAANAGAPAEGAPNRGPRDNNNAGRPPRERFGDKGRSDKAPGDKSFGERNKGKFKGGDRDKGGRDGRPDRNDRGGGATRPYATSAAPRERDRPIDPNSPFAKLAALKEQLAGRKD
jgi:ATP-dependent RNA helicase SUPV3L1/SUV3